MITAATLDLATQLLPICLRAPHGTAKEVRRALARAVMDIGVVLEEPLGSNRGWMIDEYLRRAGVPESEIAAGRGYWCAAAVGAWWEDAGLETPPGRASCDQWMRWAKATGRWSAVPVVGAAVLYGKPGDAQHIGLVGRTHLLVLSIEANTTIEAGFSRNGVGVALKEVTPKTDPILGYCRPFPAEPATPPPAA